jgi:signal transduction histidine kinase
MAKKVVSAQGGAIIFKSIEGKGSTFGFSFPRATAEVKDSKTPAAPKAEHNLATAKTKA